MLHHLIFLLDKNVNKSTIGFDFHTILFILVNFHDDLRSRTMLSNKCLNFKFLYLKLCKNDGLLV